MIRWGGWIKARRNQIKLLKELGVTGKMIYNPNVFEPCVEYCECNHPTIERLIETFPGFWPESFTGYVVKTNKHLLRISQKYWKMDLSEYDKDRNVV